jgi:hypothetical protein
LFECLDDKVNLSHPSIRAQAPSATLLLSEYLPTFALIEQSALLLLLRRLGKKHPIVFLLSFS